jgi:hypothetical protein
VGERLWIYIANYRTAREALDATALLEDHGGCVTAEGEVTMQRHMLPMLQKYHFPIADRIRKPARLE